MRILISLMLFSLLSFNAYAASTQSLANVTMAKNSVQVKTKKADWHPARKNEALQEGDQIRTGKGSASEITFANTGSKVKLGELSQITVENESNDVKLSFGKVFVSVVKGKGGMKIKSPVAVAAVLGTVGALDYHPTETQYTLTSIDGSFYITDAKGNTATLKQGYKANLTSDGIEITVADIIALIQNNSDALTASFIRVGVSPDNIKINPATGQEVIQIDTADPNQKIEINTTTGDTTIIRTNTNTSNNTNTNNTTNTNNNTNNNNTNNNTNTPNNNTNNTSNNTTTTNTTTTNNQLTTNTTTNTPTNTPTPAPAPTHTTPPPAPTPPPLPPSPPPVLPPTPTTTVNMPITIY